MLFWQTGVLSERQFLKHLGKDIFIYPFHKSKLKGSTYNLTASCVAYYIDKKTHENVSVVDGFDKITIPIGKTVLIQTEESIFVNGKICGTYHSKVSLVSKGLNSISTTLDPFYFGSSLIAVSNHSDTPIKLSVGDTFCSLMLYKMVKAKKSRHDNISGRPDVSHAKIDRYEYNETYKFSSDWKSNSDSEFDLNNRRNNRIEKWFKEDFRTNQEALKSIVKNERRDRNYEKIKLVIDIVVFIISIFLLGYIISRVPINSNQLIKIFNINIQLNIFIMIWVGIWGIAYKKITDFLIFLYENINL